MKSSSGSAFASGSAALARRIRQRKRPVQERAQATVDAVLEATLQVLKRDGYLALTTTRVAERAGVSVGTLYQYFPDKASLVMALKVRYFERLVASVRGAAAKVEGAPLEVALPALIAGLLDFKRANVELSMALREPMVALGGEGLVRDASSQLLDATRRILTAARPDLKDVTLRAQTLNAAIEGVLSAVMFQTP
ncbi:MAG: TetR/AcrR family transcriptional regulator, partial [Myxococcaceae bacterium]|nr:TetR/AcrR family transcriptional regulator [Myxococcaceae bacterium]